MAELVHSDEVLLAVAGKFREWHGGADDECCGDAQEILDVAVPLLREQIAREITDQEARYGLDDDIMPPIKTDRPATAYLFGMNKAAQIARGTDG